MIFFLLLFLLTSHFVTAQNTPSGVSVSPYVLAIQQPDGATLRIIGRVDQGIAYTETEDGYTLLKNDRDFYEYAKKGAGGKLKFSGIKAKDAADRSKKEKKMLRGITQHLRYQSPYRQLILKKMGNQPYFK